MMSHKVLKRMLVAGFLLPCGGMNADIDTSLWDGVLDAFVKIHEIDDHFKASKLVFERLNDDYSSLYLNLNVYKEKRQAAFACIKESIQGLELQLENAIAYKEKVEYDASVEQATLRAQIEATRTAKQAIINGLEAEKVALQDEIDYLKLDLATLEALNTEKVDQALIDIDAAIKSYQDMVTEREAFMVVLDDVLNRAASFEAVQTSEISEMSGFCNNN